jgi:hypothetical protein
VLFIGTVIFTKPAFETRLFRENKINGIDHKEAGGPNGNVGRVKQQTFPGQNE